MFLHKTRNIADMNSFAEASLLHNPKIVYVVKLGDSDLRFTLTEILTPAEDTDLGSFIASFVDDTSIESPVRLLGLAKSEARDKYFHNINYKHELVTDLIPERQSGTMKGEVQQVIWYESMGPSNFPITPVIKVDIVYTRSSVGFALYRETKRWYYREDGTIHEDFNPSMKYYYVNDQDMIDEGIKRRSLLVKSVQIPVMNLMMEVLMPLGVTETSVIMKGRRFMDSYETQFVNFINNSSTVTDPQDVNYGRKSVIVALENESDIEFEEWLNKSPNSLGGAQTIKQWLIEEFNI